MLAMLEPGLGYNMQFSRWKDAAGDMAKYVSSVEAQDSIAYALKATQGPQQLLNLLESCELGRYLCERVPAMPIAHALLQESACHAFCSKLILAVWRNDHGDQKVLFSAHSLAANVMVTCYSKLCISTTSRLCHFCPWLLAACTLCMRLLLWYRVFTYVTDTPECSCANSLLAPEEAHIQHWFSLPIMVQSLWVHARVLTRFAGRPKHGITDSST